MANRNYTAKEVCNVQVDIVAGAAADTDIAIAKIKTTDELIAVIESAVTTAILTDRFANTEITSNGNIQCSDATDGDILIVVWHKLTLPGFYYPDSASPTDQVKFKSLNNVKFTFKSNQNIGVAEDLTKSVYSHAVGTDGGKLRVMTLGLKLTNHWGTDEQFDDLVTFIFITVNQSEKEFKFVDNDNMEYNVRFVTRSFNYFKIPGTSVYQVTLKVESA